MESIIINDGLSFKGEIQTNLFKIAELKGLNVNYSITKVILGNDNFEFPVEFDIAKYDIVNGNMVFELNGIIIDRHELPKSYRGIELSTDGDMIGFFGANKIKSISVYIHYNDSKDEKIRLGLSEDTISKIIHAEIRFNNRVVGGLNPNIKIDIDKDREFPINNLFYMNKLKSYDIVILERISTNMSIEKDIIFDIRQIVNSYRYIQLSSYSVNENIKITLYRQESDYNDILTYVETILSEVVHHKLIRTVIEDN